MGEWHAMAVPPAAPSPMDRQTFLDAQSWLRRVHEDEFAWPLDAAQRPREGVRQLLPPASERSARLPHVSPSAPVVSCSGCFHQASRICYFRVADAKEDQTVLQVEVVAIERHRGGVNMLLVRFDREAVFEIALSAVQSVVLPVEPKPDTTNKLPPFGELNFGSVHLRMWLEPYDMASQDARRAMSNALRRIEMLRSELMLRLREKELPSTPMHQAFRHNPWIQNAGDQAISPSPLIASALLARGTTVLKSSAEKDTLKNAIDMFADRKRKRDPQTIVGRRRDAVDKSSEDDVSEEQIEPAQRDPESEGNDPLTTAESFELLSALAQAFGDDHVALQRLLRIRDDSECSEHEACSALSQAEGSVCVLKKWRKWDDFLQLAKHAVCANNKRQRITETTGVSSEQNEVIVEAGKVLAGAFLEPTDVEALEAAHSVATNRLRELESMLFSSVFPKPTDLPHLGERPPRTPVKPPRQIQNATTPIPARHSQEQTTVPPTATEHVLNLLVESRRALGRANKAPTRGGANGRSGAVYLHGKRVAMADVQTAQELQAERERSQKMKQENQVLLKKLHDVVGRYRQLQQQYQSMVSERQDQQQQAGDGSGATATSNAATNASASDANKAGDASPTNSSSAADDAATKKLEAEKHELIEKLKQVVGTCRIMQKQLQEAKEENEILRSPAKPPGSVGGGAFSPSRGSDAETAMEALQIRVINLERDLAQKEEEKEEIVGKLKEVISRYQSLQRQLEEKVGEHDAATSKIAALELELRTQQSASASSSTTSTVGWMRRGSGNKNNNNDDHAKDKEIAKLKDDAQKLAVAVTQEEARTAVLREENARLKEQVTSILQEKEQLERDYSAEHSGSTKQLADVQRELKLMRKQQEDAEQLYLEVASKLNHTLRENGDLQSRLKSLQGSIDEADKLREQTKHDHAVEMEKLKEQLGRANASVAEASSQSGKLAELKTQLEALTTRDKTLAQVERELTNFEVMSITELVAKKDAAHQEQCAELQRRVEELNKSLSSAEDVSGTRQEQLDAAMKRIQELSVAADHASDLQNEVEALRSSGSDRSAAISKMEETIATLRADLAKKKEELTSAQHTWDSNSAATSTELVSLREEIEKLQAQLATASESSASSAEEVSTLRHELSHASEACESLRSELKMKYDSLQEVGGKIQSLTESLTEKESELLAATNALEEAKKHAEDLRASRAGESEVLAALQAEVSNLRSQHAHDLAAKDVSLEESVKQLKEDHERAISELQSRLEKISADTELQVEAHTKEVQSVRVLCEALEGEKAELALTNTKLQEQLSAAEERATSEKHAIQTEFSARISELEEQVTDREGDVTALRCEVERLNADLSSLRDEHTLLLNTAGDSTKELSASHEATLAARREEYEEAVAKLEARIAEKDEQMGKLRVEVASLQTQVMTMEAQQLQVDAESAELENELRERIAVLERECDAAKKEAADLLEEKDSLQVQVSQLMEEQESTLMQKEETEHMCREHEEENDFLRGEVEELRGEVTRTHQLVERYAGEITAVHEHLSAVPVLQENADSGSGEIDSIRRVNVDLVLKSVHARLARTEELESELKELTLSMEAQKEDLTAAVAALSHAQSQADEGIAEMESLKTQLQSVETEKDVLVKEMESSRQRVQTQAETIAKLEADITAIHQEREAEVSNSMTVASEKLSEVTSRLQETESELVAIKAENTRVVFEVAKTTDSAAKQKQDFEELQVQWKAKCEHAEQLETKIRELESVKTTLEEDVQSGVTSIEQLREELAATQEAATSLQAESAQALEERAKNVQKLEQEVSSLSEQIETLRQELESTTARVETLTEELSGLKEHNTSTEEERLLLQEQLTDACIISQKLEVKLEEMTKANSKLTEDLGTAEASLKQLQDEMSAIHETKQEEILTVNRALEAKTELVDSLHQMVAKTNQRSESLAYELESTKIELSALSEEVSEWKSKVEFLEEEKITIAEQLATTSAEKQALADELLALQDTNTQQINVLEAKVDAKTAELHELNALLSTVQQEKTGLQDEILALRGQFDEHSSALSDHSALLDAAKQELIIQLDSLKSDNQALHAEKNTLSATVQSLEEAASTANAQLAEARNSIAVNSEQLSTLEIQVSDLTTQLEAKDQELIVVTERWHQQDESARTDEEERTNLRTKVSEMTSEVAKKDEIICKLKTKTEEVVGMYKKLKEHTQELQERFAEKSAATAKLQEERDALQMTNQTLSDESAVAAAKLSAVEEELSGAKTQLGQLQEQLATSVGSKSDELAAARSELEAVQSKLEKLTSEHEAKLAAQEAELATRSATVEREKAEFAATIAAKDVENQEVVDKMKELLTRYRELQEQHRQLEEEVTRTKSELDHSVAELAAFRSEQSGSGAAHEKTLAELQGEIASLRAQLDIEIEGSNAARTALEVYKKRAATALKKATHESKSSIKKVEEETSQLQDEVNTANARVAVLEMELEQAKKLLAEASAVAEAQIRTVKEKVEDERVRKETSWKQQLETIQTELSGVQAELLAKAHLDARIDELVANNESLQTEIEALKKEVQQKSEVAREMMKVKDGEIAMLTKQLEEVTRTAATNAEQLKNAQDELKEAVRAASAGRTTRSVASPRGSTEEEESNHLAAVMADVKSSIQLSTSGSNGTAVDGQILKLARAQAMRDEEATKSKKQMHTLEEQVHLYQKKYEDALALLEESNRQKRRIQELSARTTDGLNIEYLKNVVIKYIESQNQSEKDRLIPVIATVLHFSPQEVKRINDVQTKAHEESAGLLGGVFSLFGAAPAAPAPKPLAIPHNLNLKQPSPNASGVLGGAQEVDEEDHLTPLNPFASNNY